MATVMLCTVSGRGQSVAVDASSNKQTIQHKLAYARALCANEAFTMADEVCEEVLALSPDNKTALTYRKAIERSLICPWEQAPRDVLGMPIPAGSQAQDAIAVTQAKLASIILPRVSFDRLSVRDALASLQRESVKRDKTSHLGSRGVSISLHRFPPSIPPTSYQVYDNTKVSLQLHNIPLLEVLKYVATQCARRVEVGADQVWLVPYFMDSFGGLIKAEFHARPEQLGLDGKEASPPVSNDSSDAVNPAGTVNVQAYLESKGVQFPAGASATYEPATDKLVTWNLVDELVMTRGILDQTGSPSFKQPSFPSTSLTPNNACARAAAGMTIDNSHHQAAIPLPVGLKMINVWTVSRFAFF